jgi:hypothetical protein
MKRMPIPLTTAQMGSGGDSDISLRSLDSKSVPVHPMSLEGFSGSLSISWREFPQ